MRLPQEEGRIAVLVLRAGQEAPLDAVRPVGAAVPEILTRVVETGTVCQTTGVHARETLVDAPQLHNNLTITRVLLERVVDGPVPVHEDNGMTMLAVVEEMLVVEMRWTLQEEIPIRTQRVETHQPQRITLRSEEVQVERVSHAEEHT